MRRMTESDRLGHKWPLSAAKHGPGLLYVSPMRRRDFITLLGGGLADQAIPANAQEPVRVRTVGVLMGFANDAEAKARLRTFEQGFEREGWSVGQDLRVEYRYAEGDSVRMQALAKELVELMGSAALGQVGSDWQLGGFAPTFSLPPPRDSSSQPPPAMDGSTSQLVQAMAGFGGGGGGGESLNTAPLSADTSQQTFLTTPQHA